MPSCENCAVSTVADCAAMRVKICGITSLNDAREAVAAGADALGFVFYPPSPRAIGPQLAAQIIAQLPPFVTTVGLFVNEDPQRVVEIAEQCRLDVLQLHGDEAPEQCVFPGRKVIKALRLRDERDLAQAAQYRVDALLVDAWVADAYGGTGQLGRWDLARQLASGAVVILAGGLTPDNVAEAVDAVSPFAVDVSSGVEAAPGKKDPLLMQAFVKHAKHFRS